LANQNGKKTRERKPDYGPDDPFFIAGLPKVTVEGQRRFPHGGDWFALINPWLECWSDDSYERSCFRIFTYDSRQ